MTTLLRFPEYTEFRARARGPRNSAAADEQASIAANELPPREAIDEVIQAAHSAVAADLLTRVIKQPPEFLELLVLQLLVRMGYGGLEIRPSILVVPATPAWTA